MKETRAIANYLSSSEISNLKKFVKGKETPFLVVNLKRVAHNYDELKNNLPFAKIYYAVKANPLDEIVKLLEKKGSNFDKKVMKI